ncbi:MAG TPA: response regulator transcription factor [Aliidongia sp.]|nr:response regulator transcription factor [Aliidongia sp.]
MAASDSAPISIAILAAEPDLRQRLGGMITSQPGLVLAGSAAEPAALAELIDRDRIDLVLATPAPTPLGMAVWFADHRRVPFLALIDETDPDRALDALQAGAGGALPLSAAAEDIAAAAGMARHGMSVLPGEVLRVLLRPGGGTDISGNGLSRPELTQRELDVLTALADGASNKAIARRLGISFHTVKFHVAAILAKLGAESRTEAVAQAARRGLVML